ncbi:GNAT family N-acetyltransferase [Paenarthrobacter sp. NPDC056912]|uniref:GNAT family N-acetyltransferase n=1 Tax=Paenarthrobacter sp. NPDC056912 TaxID=3345965 RepID=UPI00366B4EBF
MSGDYQIRRFEPAVKNEPDYDAAVAWSRAVAFGFHEERKSEKRIDRGLAMSRADRSVFTGVYQTGEPAPHSLGEDVPVATFATWRKTLNVGFGTLLDTHLISSVTVRTSHRRRGLLRQMMSEDLALAKEDGVAIAALTASEASIYGRFGFGVATSEQSITVDTTSRFRLNHVPVGTVEVADPKVLLELAPQVFEQQHRLMPGSIDRQESYRQFVAGLVGRGGADGDGGPDAKVKTALHYSSDGAVDGYVSYKFSGWETEPAAMEIMDLVAANSAAYLELWQYLGAIDLVERVKWGTAPVDNPLIWALEDPRCVKGSEPRDMLWLRILDVRKALEARQFATDGTVVLKVHDSLGLTPGTFSLDVRNGQATVTASDATPDLELDISALSSIYLGAVHPASLVAAGRIQEKQQGAAFLAARMFAVERPAFCPTHF